MGHRIFLHAIGQVFHHLGPALRISGLLYVVPALIGQLILWFVVANAVDPATALRSPVTWVPLLVTGVSTLWIAVAWHRYVLMDEHPGAVLPRFRGDRLLAYFGRSLLLALVVFALGVVIMIPIGFLTAGIAQSAKGPLGMIYATVPALVGYVLISLISYRFALILPASAVEKPMKLSEAWAATSGETGAMFGLAFLSAVAILVLTLPIGWIGQNVNWWVAYAWELMVSWIGLLVGISILTTLYGHYVEKRQIA